MHVDTGRAGNGYGHPGSQGSGGQGNASSRCEPKEDPNALWHSTPPGFRRRHVLPDRAPTQPPTSAGNVLSRSGDQDGEANASTAFVRMLWTLHEDLCAYVFLFVEVNAVSHSSGSCRRLWACIWANRAFWQTYTGPCLTVSMPSPNLQASALRESFRKWIFHLDGAWMQDFRDFLEQCKSSEFGADFMLLLTDARYIAAGLMPHDSRHAVGDFARLLCELLAEYNPLQLDERREAEALAAQVERRSDVFTEEEVRDIMMSLDRSIEHAILDQPAEDGELEPERFLDPMEDVSDEERFPEPEEWNNIEFEPPGGNPGGSNALFEAFDRGENFESFWRDTDGTA